MLDTLIENLAKHVGRTRAAEFGERIWAEPNTGCWLWSGAHSNGRAAYFFDGKYTNAARAVWTVMHSDPGNMHVCHTCDEPMCLNPDHLWLGTHRDNVRDMVQKKRNRASRHPDEAREIAKRVGSMNDWAKGTGNPKAKLNEQQVLEIFNSTEKTDALMERFGISRAAINAIRRGDSWREVTHAKR